jgi:DNA recombination protein RmuC
MEWILGILVGAAVSGAVALIWHQSRAARCQADLANATSRAAMLDSQLAAQQQELASLRHAERELASLQSKLQSKEEQFAEQKKLLDDAQNKLKDAFRAVGSEALAVNNQQFIQLAKKTFENLLNQSKVEDEKTKQAIDSLLKPIRESLEKHQQTVETIEKKRLAEKSSLEEQLKQIAQSHEKLSSETGKLVTALRRPHQRGRWGEVQLRNTVELAGMTNHCDFDEQVTIWNGESAQRPDMVIHLPGRGVIPVDSKVAIEAYLDAIECQEGDSRMECLRRHAAHLDNHVRALANKKYWAGFDGAHSPQLVVLFMPLESALVAALEIEPDLHAEAMQQHVLIATPTLLVALLRAVAYGWQQQALQENAKEISKVGRELYDRLSTFVDHFARVGSALESSTKAYNSAIGSLSARVIPTTRKLKELHVVTEQTSEIEPPPPIEIEVRGEGIPAELRSLPGLEDATVGPQGR